MTPDAPCVICGGPAPHIAFCTGHTDGWLKSAERKQVDFADEVSYNQFVETYATRYKAELNGDTLPSEERASENDSTQEV